MEIKPIEIQSKEDISKLKQALSDLHTSLYDKKAMLNYSFEESIRLTEIALNHRMELYRLWHELMKL